MLDSVQYVTFPNFCPWYGEGLPLTYQFRPDADSPDTCYFDIWMLIRCPDNGPRPPAPKMIKLAPDEKFEPHIGAMGKIFDQDDENMPFVQIGMKPGRAIRKDARWRSIRKAAFGPSLTGWSRYLHSPEMPA